MQGCVLSPVLSNIFAVLLTVVLQRFSEDTGILAELVNPWRNRRHRWDQSRLWTTYSFAIAARAH